MNPYKSLTAGELASKLRSLRRLLLPLLSGSRAQRKAKVNGLLRAGYSAIATNVGNAINRDLQKSMPLGITVARPSSEFASQLTPFANDLGEIASRIRSRPVLYAHLMEQVEAEYLNANGLTLPERLS